MQGHCSNVTPLTGNALKQSENQKGQGEEITMMHGDQLLFFHPLLLLFWKVPHYHRGKQHYGFKRYNLNDCVCLPLPVLCLCHALFSWPGLFALKHFALNVIYLMLLLNL